MFGRLLILWLLAMTLPCAAQAQSQASAQAPDRQFLGWGRLFNNDFIGDGQDRWRTGSYAISVLQGPEWSGSLPQHLGDILEYRLSAQIVAPSDLIAPDASDRRYVGALTFGLHTHADWQGFETSLGADLVVTGPQTGIGRFQTWAHDILSLPKPDLSNQIGDGFHPTVTAEMGRSIALGSNATFRPFVAAQAGVETYLRVGGDLVVGSFGQGALMLRDDATGQRYRGITSDRMPALSLTLGGDVARVFSSVYLPSGGAAVASDTRSRLRAGVQWQGQVASVFYGVTYLAPEYKNQPEGQVVGSLNVNLRF